MRDGSRVPLRRFPCGFCRCLWRILRRPRRRPVAGAAARIAAGMAELVDALDSKSSTGDSVRVRVSLPAPDSCPIRPRNVPASPQFQRCSFSRALKLPFPRPASAPPTLPSQAKRHRAFVLTRAGRPSIRYDSVVTSPREMIDAGGFKGTCPCTEPAPRQHGVRRRRGRHGSGIRTAGDGRRVNEVPGG